MLGAEAASLPSIGIALDAMQISHSLIEEPEDTKHIVTTIIVNGRVRSFELL